MQDHQAVVVVGKVLDGLDDDVVKLRVRARPTRQDLDQKSQASDFSELDPVHRLPGVSAESSDAARVGWGLDRSTEQTDLKWAQNVD